MAATNRLYHIFSLLLLCLPLGCASLGPAENSSTTESSSAESDASKKSPPQATLQPFTNDDKENEDKESLLLDEEIFSDEAGFCQDDLYTNYLKENQGKIQANPLSPALNSHETSSAPPSSENLDLFPAPLSPEESIYFGDLAIEINPQVEKWLHYFKTTGRCAFTQWMARGEGIAPLLKPLLKKEGVPEEFFYLAMIESGFDNRAYSSAHAGGTWQLVAETARRLGLTINHWVDERRDPVKSTRAAARYLRSLYGQYGNWYLTMAAYNGGPLRVEHAIARGKSRDFWQLCRGKYFNEQTKQFVPKILATLILGSQPREHGFNLQQKTHEGFPQSTVKIEKQVSLANLAQALNVSLAQLKRWNPELLRESTPPYSAKEGAYGLRLPERLTAKYAKIQDQLLSLPVKKHLSRPPKRYRSQGKKAPAPNR